MSLPKCKQRPCLEELFLRIQINPPGILWKSVRAHLRCSNTVGAWVLLYPTRSGEPVGLKSSWLSVVFILSVHRVLELPVITEGISVFSELHPQGPDLGSTQLAETRWGPLGESSGQVPSICLPVIQSGLCAPTLSTLQLRACSVPSITHRDFSLLCKPLLVMATHSEV